MIRPLTLAAIGLLALLSVALFQLKYEVRGLEEDLRDLDRQLAADEEAVHVLKAEWSFLNRPERLQALAETYLDLEPVAALQIGALYRIPERRAGLWLPRSKPQAPRRPASYQR